MADQPIRSRSTRAYQERPDYKIQFEPTARRIRVAFNGEIVADSTRAMLMLESKHLPVYYLPLEDVRPDAIARTEHRSHCPFKGDAVYWTVTVGDRSAENALWAYPDPFVEAPDLRGYAAFYWDRMGAWFEEDEEIVGHPRDPYHRVDAIRSRRQVEVVLAGETIATSRDSVFVFETGLRPRYYLPRAAVRPGILMPSDTKTVCPYKGRASYHTVRLGDRTYRDLVWYYPQPMPACAAIADFVCFYDEKVDAVRVGRGDGV
jgi:uncharacterized protein (DUF427 family)